MLLWELLIVAFIVGIGIAFAVPEFSRWQKERLVEAGTTEIISIIRRTQTEARTGEKSKGSVPQFRRIIFAEENGRVRYYAFIGPKAAEPRGWLPEEIRITPKTVLLQFDENGFPSETKNYQFIVMSEDESRAKRVTVAMYTGRIRVEDAW